MSLDQFKAGLYTSVIYSVPESGILSSWRYDAFSTLYLRNLTDSCSDFLFTLKRLFLVTREQSVYWHYELTSGMVGKYLPLFPLGRNLKNSSSSKEVWSIFCKGIVSYGHKVTPRTQHKYTKCPRFEQMILKSGDAYHRHIFALLSKISLL